MEIAEKFRPPAAPAKESQNDTKTEPKVVAGYTTEDLMRAPFEAPHPTESDDYELTANPKIKFMMTLAIVLLAIGLMVVLFVPILGVAIIVLAAITVIFGVFFPVK